MHQTLPSWLELNSRAFKHNITLLKQAAGTQKIALVVKGNAYGHGIIPIAQLAQCYEEIDWVCTANLSEAVTIRQIGMTKPILVLAYLDASLELIPEHNIHVVLFDYETALQLNNIGQKHKTFICVHIKIDTGMSRLGIYPSQLVPFLEQLSQLPFIKVTGIFTHLSDAMDENFSISQLEKFDAALDIAELHGYTFDCIHALSSSGLHIPTKRDYTMVRIGAAAYGLVKSIEHRTAQQSQFPFLQLQPMLSWKTRPITVKTIDAGSYVGYNKTFQAKQKMRIALLPIGYYEGYPRALSNNSQVYLDTTNAPVIGIISMNLMAIDVSHISQVSTQSEITLIGHQPGITARECAAQAGLITNEFITSLSHAITRIII